MKPKKLFSSILSLKTPTKPSLELLISNCQYHFLCVQMHYSVISYSMPSGNSFSIPRHSQLIFMLATWFHNKHKQFVSIVFSSYSVMTLFIGPQALWV